ncbi:cytochrome P450 4c3 isoform X1 [Dendroctonus ponderosae]|uniref:cytochrome P450 4c3 isoform X1 n=1 Tax=Dendroctonus ponderosae TaxID=77166 RepID=UPI002035A335|nr:cytochrome P450 4c3 isoform X1 [Dendroctonus ponderosae]
MFFILCAVTAILLLLYIILNSNRIKSFWRRKTLVEKLPCVRKKFFLIGHLDFVGITKEEAFVKTREWTKDAPAVAHLITGPLMFVGLKGPYEIESAIGSMKHMEKSFLYKFLNRWLGEGLLTSTGLKWQKRRKMLTPAFHFTILQQFVSTFNKEVKRFVDEIETGNLNKPTNIVPFVSNFSLATIAGKSLSKPNIKETSMGSSEFMHTQESIDYKNAVSRISDVFYLRFSKPWTWIQPIFDLSSLRKIERQSLETLHQFTNFIIEKRSENFKTFDENLDDMCIRKKLPLLDILINAKIKHGTINNDEIREEVDTFMFEGHDTTAMCLTYTTMLLACHKDIQEEVYQEIIHVLGPNLAQEPSHEDFTQMCLLDRCIKESLRLYPPVPTISRYTSEDINTKFGVIPEGVELLIHLYDLHRNPKFWPNPDVFDPSRHLPENCIGRHPFAYIPFSAGPRNCIGQKYAMLEIKAFFCGVLRKFRLEPVDTPDTLVMTQDVMLRSQNGVKVNFVLRN